MLCRTRLVVGLMVFAMLLNIPACKEKEPDFVTVNGSVGIKNGQFYIGLNTMHGGINRIQNLHDDKYVNYAIGEDAFPGREKEAKWLGDVDFEYRLGTGDWQKASTTYSGDSRETAQQGDSAIRVSYEIPSTRENGIRDFSLQETYRFDGDEFIWEITITNTSDYEIEFGSIGFPLMFASPLRGTEQDYYEQATFVHSCIAYNSSYFYISPNSGTQPILVMYPKDDTSLEYQNWPDRTNNYQCQTVYTCASKQLEDNPATDYLDTSSKRIVPSGKLTFSFGFSWAENYEELSSILYEADKIAVSATPGMTTTTDLPVTLDLFTKHTIHTLTPEFESETQIRAVKEENDHHVFEIQFNHLGENKITIQYGDDLVCTLVFFVMEPLEKLILKNCEFIAENQQQTDPEEPTYMAFLPWDMVMENLNGDGLVDENNFYSQGYRPTTWWACGGDEMGYGSGLYLSEKNVYWPDEAQIKKLVDYLNVFIYDNMTEQFPDGSYRLHRGAPRGVLGTWEGNPGMDEAGRESNEDCWRSYNYLHVINTYYNMYLIQMYYAFDIENILPAKEYLLRAYELARTFFTAWMFPIGGDERGKGGIHFGNMGESMFPYLVTALEKEGYQSEADWLQEQLDNKAEYLGNAAYPYTSESAFDTVAYEAIYAYGKMSGNNDLIEKVTAANIATRGQTPVWYLYGSDLPTQDGFITLRYMTQIGGWALLDYTLNYSQNKAYDIKLAYGSYMAGWALINSGFYDDNPNNQYASVWYYQGCKGETMYSLSENELLFPIYNGGVARSGESAMGFWGGLKMAATVMIQDPVLGLYTYGGESVETDTEWTITPKDGVRKRVYLLNTQIPITVELAQDRFSTLHLNKSGDYLKAHIENTTGTARTSTICLSGIQAGEYSVMVNGVELKKVILEGKGNTEISYAVPASKEYELIFCK